MKVVDEEGRAGNGENEAVVESTSKYVCTRQLHRRQACAASTVTYPYSSGSSRTRGMMGGFGNTQLTE